MTDTPDTSSTAPEPTDAPDPQALVGLVQTATQEAKSTRGWVRVQIALLERWAGIRAWWRAFWTMHALHREAEQARSQHAQGIAELYHLAKELGEGGQDLTELIFRIWGNAQSFAQQEDAKLRAELVGAIEKVNARLRWYEQRCEPIRYQKERFDAHVAKLNALAAATTTKLQPEVTDGSAAAPTTPEQPTQPNGGSSPPEGPLSQGPGPHADGQAGTADLGWQPYESGPGTS